MTSCNVSLELTVSLFVVSIKMKIHYLLTFMLFLSCMAFLSSIEHTHTKHIFEEYPAYFFLHNIIEVNEVQGYYTTGWAKKKKDQNLNWS